ncbi:hypothetical protein FE257_002327 [Aspergillus nanangensis]|uniref:Uncharacterized protein n=1 Tax=Aspergillus nanangensis TaxID=2582783 RepID=A0AAD4GP44_ASPNN|nr:hypothetical protein FE257_002327 [Aspergillus nanangensis]
MVTTLATLIVAGLSICRFAGAVSCEADDLEVVLIPGQSTIAREIPLSPDTDYATISFANRSQIFEFRPLDVPHCAADEYLLHQISIRPDMPTGSATFTFIGSNVTCHNILIVPPGLFRRMLASRIEQNRIVSQCSKDERNMTFSGALNSSNNQLPSDANSTPVINSMPVPNSTSVTSNTAIANSKPAGNSTPAPTRPVTSSWKTMPAELSVTTDSVSSSSFVHVSDSSTETPPTLAASGLTTGNNSIVQATPAAATANSIIQSGTEAQTSTTMACSCPGA